MGRKMIWKNMFCLNKEQTNTLLFRTKLNINQKPDTIVVEGLQFSAVVAQFLGIYIDE